VDINSNTIEEGIKSKCIDWGTLDLEEGVKDADLVIIATLVATIAPIAGKIAPYLKPGCIVTDVGSTKQEIINNVAGFLPPEVNYVPGHPMAGGETQGLAGADAFLFKNAVYILTPLADSDHKAVEVLEKIIGQLGARVLKLLPSDHDVKVAAVSHLPHVLAAALINGVSYLEEKQGGVYQLAAGGFKDLTRIAASQPEMWCDILLHNGANVLDAIALFRRALDDIEKAISQKERETILAFFSKARAERHKATCIR